MGNKNKKHKTSPSRHRVTEAPSVIGLREKTSAQAFDFFANGQATSAMFALGCAADRILAPAEATLGSIGIILESWYEGRAAEAAGGGREGEQDALRLDLKGVVYGCRLLPCTSALVVRVEGGNESQTKRKERKGKT